MCLFSSRFLLYYKKFILIYKIYPYIHISLQKLFPIILLHEWLTKLQISIFTTPESGNMNFFLFQSFENSWLLNCFCISGKRLLFIEQGAFRTKYLLSILKSGVNLFPELWKNNWLFHS